jgi:hypothetical protein
MKPVIADDGITYEEHFISKHLETSNTSPVTRAFISTHLIPNKAISLIIDDYIQQGKTPCR